MPLQQPRKYSLIVLIPQLAGPSCLLLDNTLTPTEAQYCSNVLLRAYNELVVNAYINGLGYITGANALDITSIGMDYAMLNLNADIMADAYSRTHAQLSIQNMIQGDGIRADDSFDQHEGIIYNGNYGKDFINAILQVEIQAAGTEFAANTTCMQVFEGLFQGSSWMIFRNILTGVLHWDFSVLGRFISYPASDNQATANIKMNLTQVQELGQLWNSSALVTFSQLSGNGTNANAGDLVGNNMYYTNDYMNFGFHLADGVLYTYLNGDEYEDIAAAWDWNLIPGITVDYGATPLNCATTNTTGLQAFVGGASTGKIGIGAMKYTNPLTQMLSWQKAWFFLDNDVQHVMISNIKSTTTAPVYSVLDQRRQSGSVYTGTARVGETDMQTIWHGEVGYLVPASVNVSTNVTTETGVWSTIGTSSSPPTTVNLFTAKIDHVSLSTPVSYTAFPGTDQSTFQSKTEQLRLESVSNTADVSAVFDGAHNTAMVVFWDVSGGSVTFTQPPFTLSANGNAAIIYNVGNGEITVSDPSQTLTSVKVTVGGPLSSLPIIGNLLTKTLTFNLPQGGLAGQSVTQRL
ncbi:hypothetical protein H0H81_005448 [Sphagnurus paluster]|uniref:Polysaccharide lyase family 8 protein n=1 Tax=Sphagnurus paluster TaxID=117069 RepID=A0A9P7FU83_9AGAR|nr:hypothetical protein H0H81_005448 [Sphagnurus paluster]